MKMKDNIKILLLIFLLYLTGILFSQEKMKTEKIGEKGDYSKYKNAELITDMVYGKGGEKDLKLDLFLPKKGKPPYIGIIFIHGGGWRGLYKEYLREWGYYFADKGYVAISIDYRLSGEAKFPAAVEDCKCAVRWMRANAVEYNIDANKIAVFGESAGGHLAALVGTSWGVKELEGNGGNNNYSSKVNLVFPVYGVFDVVGLGKEKLSKKVVNNLLEEFIGGSYNEVPEKYKMASPITYIDKSDPPFMLFHSTGDSVVSIQQSVMFKEKLEQAGVPVEFIITPGGEHGYVLHPPYFEPTCKQMESFMKKYFK